MAVPASFPSRHKCCIYAYLFFIPRPLPLVCLYVCLSASLHECDWSTWGRQTDRQTDRQRDRHTHANTQTDIQKERETVRQGHIVGASRNQKQEDCEGGREGWRKETGEQNNFLGITILKGITSVLTGGASAAWGLGAAAADRCLWGEGLLPSLLLTWGASINASLA